VTRAYQEQYYPLLLDYIHRTKSSELVPELGAPIIFSTHHFNK
jgi:hypothetical protein